MAQPADGTMIQERERSVLAAIARTRAVTLAGLLVSLATSRIRRRVTGRKRISRSHLDKPFDPLANRQLWRL